MIRTSRLTGAVAYEIADTPPRLLNEHGEAFVAVSLTNVRSKGRAELIGSQEEIDRRRNLSLAYPTKADAVSGAGILPW